VFGLGEEGKSGVHIFVLVSIMFLGFHMFGGTLCVFGRNVGEWGKLWDVFQN